MVVLTLAGCLLPREAAMLIPSPDEQGRENLMKGSLVEIRVGKLFIKPEYGNEK